MKLAKLIANALANAFIVLSVIVMIWIVASWVNIVCHNTQPNPTEHYWKYNAIVMFSECAAEHGLV